MVTKDSPNIIVKIIVLCSFITLMTLFVAYRAGYFDAEEIKPATINNNENASPKPNTKIDATEDTSTPDKTFIPSSKSIVLPKPEPTEKKKEKKEQNYFSSSKSGAVFSPDFDTNKDLEPLIIPSSKSGAIFRPNDIIKPEDLRILELELDSIKAARDSIKKQNKSTQQNQK